MTDPVPEDRAGRSALQTRRATGGGGTLGELERSLRQGEIAPLYLFHGEEDFLIGEAVQRVVESALEPGAREFDLDTVRGAEQDAMDISSIVASYPMMGKRRVVVVHEIDKVANLERLLPVAEQPPASASLVLISAKPDFRLKFFRAVREKGVVLECKRLAEYEMPEWVEGRIRKLGKEPSAEACQLIPSYVGRSLREVQNEIEKLVIYVGDKKSIDAGDVNSVVGMSRQFNIFELQRAMGLRNMQRAMEIMERMLKSGESPVGMIVMLTRYYQKIWLLQEFVGKRIPESQLPAQMGMSPFALREYLAAVKNYPAETLRNCFRALVEADESLKSSQMDERLTMTLLVFKLAGPG
ncbi:MAG TPA: DNA polymerase III subunit delta [Bacteroidota bacterium]